MNGYDQMDYEADQVRLAESDREDYESDQEYRDRKDRSREARLKNLEDELARAQQKRDKTLSKTRGKIRDIGREIERLRKEITKEKEALSDPPEPPNVPGRSTTLVFSRRLGGWRYAYAAIRPSGLSRWYVTGTPTEGMTWEELKNFIHPTPGEPRKSALENIEVFHSRA